MLACIACLLSTVTSSTADDLSQYGALKIVFAYSVIKTKILQFLIAFLIFLAIFLLNICHKRASVFHSFTYTLYVLDVSKTFMSFLYPKSVRLLYRRCVMIHI